MQNAVLCRDAYIIVAHNTSQDALPYCGLVQGWGLLSQFPPFRYFPIFSALSNHTLAIEYHVYIWQVSPQLSCSDTCQIWMWFEESNMCFCQVENFAYGEINEQSFSNPHPRPILSIHLWVISLALTAETIRLLQCQCIQPEELGWINHINLSRTENHIKTKHAVNTTAGKEVRIFVSGGRFRKPPYTIRSQSKLLWYLSSLNSAHSKGLIG